LLKPKQNVPEPNSEESYLISLIKKHEADMTSIKDKWVSINTSLPPNTNHSVVLHDGVTKANTLFGMSHVFLKHYLLDRFHYGFDKHPLWKNITYIMVLSDPE
jgi:hypothetical protein